MEKEIMQDVKKRLKKGKNTKLAIISAAAAIVILLAVLLITDKEILAPEEKVIELTADDFAYSGYFFENETYLKTKCPYIRVGRCDKLGGEFSQQCWFREVKLKYELKDADASYSDIQCEAKNKEGAVLGTETFSSKEETIGFETDIRKMNELTLCCSAVGKGISSNTLCLPSVKISAIC